MDKYHNIYLKKYLFILVNVYFYCMLLVTAMPQ